MQFRPGGAAGVLGDAGEQEGESAEDDVGADALLFPVVDRPRVEMLHISPAALNFQELSVAKGDVLGGHLRVGGAQQELPSRFSSALALAASMLRRPPEVTRR